MGSWRIDYPLLLAALVWLWFDSMRARERALLLGACPRAASCCSWTRRWNAWHSVSRATPTGDGAAPYLPLRIQRQRQQSAQRQLVMLGGEVESFYTEPYLINEQNK
jgi:hypothetical protein